MRFFVVILAGFFLLVLQSVLLEFFPWTFPPPALGLLVVVHVGVNAAFGMRQAVILAFVLGYLADLVTGAPRGTHALVYVLVALLLLGLRQRLSVRATTARVVLGFVFGLLAALGTVGVRAVVLSGLDVASLSRTPLEALSTAVAAAPVLWLLYRLDQRFEPPRTRLGLMRRERRGLWGPRRR